MQTNSLYKPEVKRLLNKFSLVVSDIDYTLSDFGAGHKQAIKKLADIFNKKLAKKLDEMFYLILEGHRFSLKENWQNRGKYNQLVKKIKKIQKNFIPQYGPKLFSREAWSIIAAQELGLKITSQQVKKIRDIYWQNVGQGASIYPDAQVFMSQIKRLKLPFILMSGSDSILRVRSNLELNYDPEFATNYKQTRVAQLPLEYDKLVIGDPIDKPDKRFFNKLFKVVENLNPTSKSKILVVGDSERNDLEIPRSLGCSTLLIKRN